MASAPSITTLVSDLLSKSSSNEVSQQDKVDNHLPRAANSPTLTNPAENKLSKDLTPANGTSNQRVPETKQEQSNAGEKRELEAASTTEQSTEKSTEPDSKKQKPNNATGPVNDQPVSARSEKGEEPAPEKKKGGRPRKTKESVKKDIPTDGIGSRTRSRTKVVS
ncbi:hypothetical protein BDV18DRAFT_156675 [Aspergillus unguis]